MLVHIKPKNSTTIQHDKFDKLLKLDYLKTTILQIAHSCMWSHLEGHLALNEASPAAGCAPSAIG